LPTCAISSFEVTARPVSTPAGARYGRACEPFAILDALGDHPKRERGWGSLRCEHRASAARFLRGRSLRHFAVGAYSLPACRVRKVRGSRRGQSLSLLLRAESNFTAQEENRGAIGAARIPDTRNAPGNKVSSGDAGSP